MILNTGCCILKGGITTLNGSPIFLKVINKVRLETLFTYTNNEVRKLVGISTLRGAVAYLPLHAIFVFINLPVLFTERKNCFP